MAIQVFIMGSDVIVRDSLVPVESLTIRQYEWMNSKNIPVFGKYEYRIFNKNFEDVVFSLEKAIKIARHYIRECVREFKLEERRKSKS